MDVFARAHLLHGDACFDDLLDMLDGALPEHAPLEPGELYDDSIVSYLRGPIFL